jgi:hypothetical protein
VAKNKEKQKNKQNIVASIKNNNFFALILKENYLFLKLIEGIFLASSSFFFNENKFFYTSSYSII